MFFPVAVDRAVMMARALVFPSFQASGMEDPIRSCTPMGLGGASRVAEGLRTPSGTGSPRMEVGPLINHSNPCCTASEIALSVFSGSHLGMKNVSS